MSKFGVFDNNKPASIEGFPDLQCGWVSHLFDTLYDAQCYARKWLGNLWGGSDDGKSGIVLQLNRPYEYDGCGDFIEIREVQQ